MWDSGAGARPAAGSCIHLPVTVRGAGAWQADASAVAQTPMPARGSCQRRAQAPASRLYTTGTLTRRRRRVCRTIGAPAQPLRRRARSRTPTSRRSRRARRRRLYAAAKAGQCGEAEGVLQEMAAAGLEPGPRAFHALVVAYAKTGDADRALEAVQRGYTALRDTGAPSDTGADTAAPAVRCCGARGQPCKACGLRCGRAARGSGSGVSTARARQGLHCCSTRAWFRGAYGGARGAPAALEALPPHSVTRTARVQRCLAAMPAPSACCACQPASPPCSATVRPTAAWGCVWYPTVIPAPWRRARRPAPAPYPDGSLAARGAGLPVLPESYVVLIHTFVAAGQVARAESVYESMQRQDYDIRPGWLMLTCELFRNGCGAPVGRALLASQISASGKGTWRPQRRRRADRVCFAECVSRRRAACRAAHVRITSHQAALRCRTAVSTSVTPSRRPCTMSISSLASASPCPPPGLPARLAWPA